MAKAFCASRHLVLSESEPPFASISCGDGVVVGGRGHDRNVLKILGRRAHHRRSADVDVFDDVLEVHARLGGRLLKGVEIHHHHVDGLECRALRRPPRVADCRARAGCLRGPWDASVLTRPSSISGKPVRSRDVFDCNARIAQQLRGSAGGDQLHAHGPQVDAQTRPVRFCR